MEVAAVEAVDMSLASVMSRDDSIVPSLPVLWMILLVNDLCRRWPTARTYSLEGGLSTIGECSVVSEAGEAVRWRSAGVGGANSRSENSESGMFDMVGGCCPAPGVFSVTGDGEGMQSTVL